MTRLIVFNCFVLFAAQGNAQKYNPNVNKALSAIQNPIELVSDFESLGVKSPGSVEKLNTVNWIVAQYQALGYDSIRIDSFTDAGTMVRNIIVTKSGQDSSYIVVCGHYDTRNGPGANDNGSGVAAIIETARVLKDLNTTRGIQFIHFDKEEEGFVGSDYHVKQVLGQALDSNLYLVLNIDQIGGSMDQPGNDRITCERDEDNGISTNNAPSWLITDAIANLTNLYTTLKPEIDKAFLSDYIPFEQKGYVITGLYQSASDLIGHSAADTLGNMDTVSFKQAVRLTVVASIHFAQVGQFISVAPKTIPKFSIYPNPTSAAVHIRTHEASEHITISDFAGRVVFSNYPIQNGTDIELGGFNAGSYVVTVTSKNGYQASKRVIVVK